jgi:hypothetical protein
MGRQAIHYKTKPQQKTLASLRDGAHFHFCSEDDCRLIYEDACRDVTSNGLCHLHRGGRRPVWVSARDPQECCIENCRAVIGEDLVRYKLAGPGPWYQCRTCARVHGWPCT